MSVGKKCEYNGYLSYDIAYISWQAKLIKSISANIIRRKKSWESFSYLIR